MKTLAVVNVAMALCLLVGPASAGFIVVVPGTANPNLADPATSPGPDPLDGTVPPSIAVTPGQILTFSVTGVTGNFPSGSFGPDPDGIQSIYQNATFGPPARISDYSYPLNSLIGVFLADTVGPTPVGLSSDISFLTLAPGLQQVFFIGDGLTGTGSGNQQFFTVPTDATKLFLASLDGHEWANNAGAFQANVSAVPEASSLALYGVCLAAFAIRFSVLLGHRRLAGPNLLRRVHLSGGCL